MEKYKSSLDEEIICVSYNDTKDLPIDLHTNKYRYIKYEIEEVLKRQDDIEYMITDSKTTRNLLKEVERLQKENEKIRKMNKAKHKYAMNMEDKYITEKTKNQKAIEYIKSNPNVFYDENLIDVETLLANEMTDEYVGEIKFISTLLNILQGDDDND